MAEPIEVAVPDIGDFSGIPIIEVLVAVGDRVEVEQGLVEIESDKATFEVPSPVAGTVTELKVGVGDEVSQGTVIALVAIDGPGAAAGTGTTGRRGEDEGAAGARTLAADVDPGEQATDKPNADATAPAGVQPSPTGERGSTGARATADPASGSPTQAAATGSGGAGLPPYASPTVRKLARERGVDLAQLEGTGRHGRITKDDVEDFDPGRTSSATADMGAPSGSIGIAPWPQVDFAKLGPVTREPLSKIGRLSAANLARNWAVIPHVTHHEEADVTELEAFRKALNAEQDAVKVTMVALLLKASAACLQAFPRFNASLDGDELVLKGYVHVGFAADTPNGLVVPVVRDVDRKGLLELAGEVADLSTKARAGKLMPAQMSGGNFTVSSLGGIGGTGFTPIVNAPEVAILGVVRSAIRPVWDGAGFAPRLMLPLSLSYDHRVIDGALAARFAVHLRGVLEDFRRVLL